MTDDELIALEHENWMTYLTGVVCCASQREAAQKGWAGRLEVLLGH